MEMIHNLRRALTPLTRNDPNKPSNNRRYRLIDSTPGINGPNQRRVIQHLRETSFPGGKGVSYRNRNWKWNETNLIKTALTILVCTYTKTQMCGFTKLVVLVSRKSIIRFTYSRASLTIEFCYPPPPRLSRVEYKSGKCEYYWKI